MKYRNPVIPGFHPDPSICRVGEDYYLAVSSFEFFPGVPLYHSKDLVNWELIGHALTCKSQLLLTGCGASGGIYAPTLRYHNGRFYMITTNMNSDAAPGRYPMLNFLVHTDDIYGEWSEPVAIAHIGIDPSLFWDDDGKCYYIGTHFLPDGRQCIGQFEINPDTGEKLSETKNIWFGSGGKCPEGPHMYKIGGTYYLMIAEGGTEWGHMETIARGDTVWGPFEGCPHNPIVSNRDMTVSVLETMQPGYQELGCIGHADLVEDPNGHWWLVMLGVRPTRWQLHHLGRETMLAPVEWVDGWPVVNGGKPITSVMEGPDAPFVQLDDHGFAIQNSFLFAEDFTKESSLPVRWAYVRNPEAGNYRLESGLVLTAGGDTLDSIGSPTFVAVRQQAFKTAAQTVLNFDPKEAGEAAGITVYHSNEHHYDLTVTCRDSRRVAVLCRRAADLCAQSAPVVLPEQGPVTLRIEADKLHYEFFANDTKVGEGSTQLMSSEAMAGDFTGCFFGLFCQGVPGAEAKFDSFSVR